MTRAAAILLAIAACTAASCLRPTTQARLQHLVRQSPDCDIGVLLMDLRSSEILVDIKGNHWFEPASTIKALHLLLALRAIEGGSVSWRTPVTTYLGTSGASCPELTGDTELDTLEATLRAMMLESDNHRTRTITERFGGLTALNQLAESTGMRHTKVAQHVGCMHPPNRTTLHDLARLFGRLFEGGTADSERPFQGCISTQYRDGGYADGRLWGLLYNEADGLGLSKETLAEFCRLFIIASKLGSYTIGGTEGESWAAHVRIPFRWSDEISYRYYFVGGFVSGAVPATTAHFTAIRVAVEVLRDRLRLALATFIER